MGVRLKYPAVLVPGDFFADGERLIEVLSLENEKGMVLVEDSVSFHEWAIPVDELKTCWNYVMRGRKF
jgi:hypothetical protein